MTSAPGIPPAPPHAARGAGRDALCDALIRIVARDGLDGVTFRSVAAEAGVTHGLASYHFGTRETMIKEALLRAVREAIERARIGEDVGSLQELAANTPNLLAEPPQDAVFQFYLALEAQRRPELLEQVRATYDSYISEVRATLGRLGLADDAPLARLTWAAIDGLSVQQLLYRDPTARAEALDRLREILADLPSSDVLASTGSKA
jgi:TetR/AcrR family transcriptional regulator, regulator of biofilm formation and stress response